MQRGFSSRLSLVFPPPAVGEWKGLRREGARAGRMEGKSEAVYFQPMFASVSERSRHTKNKAEASTV